MASPFFPEVIAAWQAAQVTAGEIPADQFLEAASKFVPIFGHCSPAYICFFYLAACHDTQQYSEIRARFCSYLLCNCRSPGHYFHTREE
jgi:hypothetical protein